eukprot:6354346-Prymnesium_polylepis.1
MLDAALQEMPGAEYVTVRFRHAVLCRSASHSPAMMPPPSPLEGAASPTKAAGGRGFSMMVSPDAGRLAGRQSPDGRAA